MRRVFLFAASAFLLAGCESFGDLTSDAYEPGRATQSQFLQDSASCDATAEVQRSYNIRGIAGTHVQRHEIYNRAFDICMRKQGYARRDWSPDIPFPYDVDPMPG